MSSSSPKQSWPGKLGLGLVAVTSLTLLVGLGVFSLNLLAAMFSHHAVVEPAPAPPAVVSGAAPAATATVAAAPPAKAPVDPATAALLETGKQTFMLCAACHGPDGKSIVPNMAPNLAGSVYINGPSERLAMIVLNGIQFPGTYLGQMISWKAQFTDDQIAGVLSYIRSNFGNSAPVITPGMIKAARTKHGSRNTPYTRAELDQVLTDLKE